jgi:cysteine desulfurase
VFHFLTDKSDRAKYARTLRRSLVPDGQVIIATFALDGPRRCSGLEVVRYDADSISSELGNGFELVQELGETHLTPWRTKQDFRYFRFRRRNKVVCSRKSPRRSGAEPCPPARRIYLDYNASTPIAPEVEEAMRPFLAGENYGNPSSHHWAGAGAKEAVETARQNVARLLGCSEQEIVFTSGGTESNNHAIKGVFFALRERGNHIVTTQVEHPAVLEPCRFLQRLGAEVTFLPVDGAGMVDPEDVLKAITPRTVLVSVMHANNEVGTIQPITDITRITRERGIAFHTDAAQSVGKIPTKVAELGVDLLSIAGHKLYAPKGVGALYIRTGLRLEPLMHGAGHESGRRAGTENVLLDVALGAACKLALTQMDSLCKRLTQLRDELHAGLENLFGSDLRLNGHPTQRLPNTLNVSFVGDVGSEVLEHLEGVAASTGSACHSGQHELSPVLRAMRVSEEIGLGAVRLSLGRWTTADEVDHLLILLGAAPRRSAPHRKARQPKSSIHCDHG